MSHKIDKDKKPNFGQLPTRVASNRLNPLTKLWGKKASKVMKHIERSNSLTKAEKDFLVAAHKMEKLKKDITSAEWLRAYSLYKQASVGNCPRKPPSGIFSKAKKLQYEYWKTRYGMPAEVAANRLIRLMKEFEETVTSKKIDRKSGKASNKKSKSIQRKKSGNEDPRQNGYAPTTIEEEPENFNEETLKHKPNADFDGVAASLEVDALLSTGLDNPAFQDTTTVKFDRPDSNSKGKTKKRKSKKLKNKTLVNKAPANMMSGMQSVRNQFIPTENEFKRFTLVKNTQSVTAENSYTSFVKPSYAYKGPSLDELVRQGKHKHCKYQSESVFLSGKVKVDPGYKSLLPIIHILKVEYSKEADKAPKQKKKDEFAKNVKSAVALDKFMFRLVRYLDRWFEEPPGLNSAGVRSLLISKVFLDTKLKPALKDFHITKLNIFKLLSVCMLLAAKYCEDCLIANTYWAQVAGVTIDELNRVEEIFLNATKFDLFVSNEALEKTCKKYFLVRV